MSKKNTSIYSARDASITYKGKEIKLGGEGMSRDNVRIETVPEEMGKWLYGEWKGERKSVEGTLSGDLSVAGGTIRGSSNTINANSLTAGTITANNLGVNNMSQRTTVIVELWDDSKGIEAQDSLVYSTKMITADSDQVVIQQVLLEKNVKKHLQRHNYNRTDLVNQDILERTGNTVALNEVKLKDLRWSVKR
jgi:hypothetical protein